MTTTVAQTAEEQLVVFRLAGEFYGVTIARVQEIIPMEPVVYVPRAPEFVEGVINLRGQITPVVNLHQRFQLDGDASRGKEARIVVVEMGGEKVGLMVDAVSEVLRVSREHIEPPSQLVTTMDSGYLRGLAKLDDRLIILLDLDRILNVTVQGGEKPLP
ncbi:MAG TPA: chemotaxis protein CheW [Anaerolineae bacterium]|nr:chemotaxis protein CheW [Anaerolineae bacterium]